MSELDQLRNLTDDGTKAIIESISVFKTLSETLDDKDLNRALAYIVKLIERPDVSPAHAAYIIVQLEAIAAKFAFHQAHYKTWGKAGTEERYKKDLYYTARDALRHLVDSLKYIVRIAEGGRG